MAVNNLEAQRLQSNITPYELAQAMQKVDLSTVPPERRQEAVMDQLMHVMAETINDRDKAHEIEVSRALRNGA